LRIQSGVLSEAKNNNLFPTAFVIFCKLSRVSKNIILCDDEAQNAEYKKKRCYYLKIINKKKIIFSKNTKDKKEY